MEELATLSRQLREGSYKPNPMFGGRNSELNEQAKPFERGGRGEREERQKNLKLSARFAPSAFNGLEDWAAAVCTSIFPVLPNVEGQPRGDCGRAVFSDDKAGRVGVALSRVAGPLPALRCGDLLAFDCGIIQYPSAARSIFGENDLTVGF